MLPKLNKDRAKFYLSREALLDHLKHQKSHLQQLKKYEDGIRKYVEFQTNLETLKELMKKKESGETLPDGGESFDDEKAYQEFKLAVQDFQDSIQKITNSHD